VVHCGVVGGTPRRINLLHLYSHTGGVLHGGVSEVMATCDVRSFRSKDRSSRLSSYLARYVPRCVDGFCWWPGRGDFSGARILVWIWWICRSSPTLLMGGGSS
jgi:hypothetical protein